MDWISRQAGAGRGQGSSRPSTAPSRRAMRCTRDGTFVPAVDSPDVVAVTQFLNSMTTEMHLSGAGRAARVELLGGGTNSRSGDRSSPPYTDSLASESLQVSCIPSPGTGHGPAQLRSLPPLGSGGLPSPTPRYAKPLSCRGVHGAGRRDTEETEALPGKAGDSSDLASSPSMVFRANRKHTHSAASPLPPSDRIARERLLMAEEAAGAPRQLVPVAATRDDVVSPVVDPRPGPDPLQDPTGAFMSRQALQSRLRDASWLMFWGNVQRMGGEMLSMIEQLSLSEADGARLKSEVGWLTERLSRASEDFKELQLAMVSEEQRHQNMILVERDKYQALKEDLVTMGSHVAEMRRKVTSADAAVAAAEATVEEHMAAEAALQRIIQTMGDDHALELMAQKEALEAAFAVDAQKKKRLDYLEADNKVLLARAKDQQTLIEQLTKDREGSMSAHQSQAAGTAFLKKFGNQLDPITVNTFMKFARTQGDVVTKLANITANQQAATRAAGRMAMLGQRRMSALESGLMGLHDFDAGGHGLRARSRRQTTSPQQSPSRRGTSRLFGAAGGGGEVEGPRDGARSPLSEPGADASDASIHRSSVGPEEALAGGGTPRPHLEAMEATPHPHPSADWGRLAGLVVPPTGFNDGVAWRQLATDSPYRPIHASYRELLYQHVPAGVGAMGEALTLVWDELAARQQPGSVPMTKKARERLHSSVAGLLAKASAAWRSALKAHMGAIDEMVAADGARLDEATDSVHAVSAKVQDLEASDFRASALRSENESLNVANRSLAGQVKGYESLLRLASVRIEELVTSTRFGLSAVSPIHIPPPARPSDAFPTLTTAEGAGFLEGPLPLTMAHTAHSVEDFCNAVRHEHNKMSKRLSGLGTQAEYESDIALLKAKCLSVERESEERLAALRGAEAELEVQRRLVAKSLVHKGLDISVFSKAVASPKPEEDTVAAVPTQPLPIGAASSSGDQRTVGIQCTILPEKVRSVTERLSAGSGVRRGGAPRASATPAAPTGGSEQQEPQGDRRASDPPPPVTSPINARAPPMVAATNATMAKYHVANATGQEDALYYQLQWMQRNGGVQRNLSNGTQRRPTAGRRL